MSSKPTLNPQISAALATVGAATAGISTWAIFGPVLVLITIVVLYTWLGRRYFLFETKANIARLSRDATYAQVDYAKKNPSRKGLRAYLESLKAANVPASQLCLTNFYVSTVNATGVYFPSYNY